MGRKVIAPDPAASSELRLESLIADEDQLSEVLREFAGTMATDFPIQAILDRLVEKIVGILPVTSAGVTLISPGKDPRYIAASNQDALRFEKLQTDLGEGPCLAAYNSGEAVAVPNLRTDARFPLFGPRAVEAGLAAVFTFPLRHGDRPLGALDLYRDSTGQLTDRSLVVAHTLADVVAAYLLNAQARTDLQASSERSREAALHDALTGLPNRVLLMERIEHSLLRSQRSGRMPAVFFVDLDRFKAVNDTYGHRVGDELLIAVAERLTDLFRADDTLARLSGDEFVVLCEDVGTVENAGIIKERVVAALGLPFVLSETKVDIAASVGVAFARGAEVAAEQLLHDADLAMYRVKRHVVAHRDIYDLRDEHLAGDQSTLGRDLPGALGRGELFVEYQPIVGTVDTAVVGVEALLRWMHPTRGLVRPSVLIPLAEHSGDIAEIGQWVLERAWSDRSGWPHGIGATGGDLTVSVNVSAQQLMAAGFCARLAALLDAGRSPSRLLMLEVTENIFVRDTERALLVLRDLKAMGVGLALDDFGTGFSSLSYLKRIPVDVVKIGQSFITDLGVNPASHTIVAAVIQLAHGLGMSVVADGVENAEQHHLLDLLGCDSCQGHYFARSMSEASFDGLVRLAAGGPTTRLRVPSVELE
jgi:diguanylate cyclase (GGDEF)-like protein